MLSHRLPAPPVDVITLVLLAVPAVVAAVAPVVAAVFAPVAPPVHAVCDDRGTADGGHGPSAASG